MGRRHHSSSGRTLIALALVLMVAGVGFFFFDGSVPSGGAPPPSARAVLRVHYVDVGQGDATIWELPDRSIIVYDCGPPVASLEASPVVRYLRDVIGRSAGSRIHALIGSHGHLDHIGGCEEVFDQYVVEHVYESWYEGQDAPGSYRRYLDSIRAEGATIHKLPELGPGALTLPSARASLLWPRAFASGGWATIAEASLVVRLQHGSTAFCFQGDIEARQERELAARCDVYLVGHHGSRQASSSEWLAQMGPRIAVASFGENDYGHPHPEALCRVEQVGAKLYTTARSGTIVIESDGASVRVVQGEVESYDPCTESPDPWASHGG